jgi:hypothetical protein
VKHSHGEKRIFKRGRKEGGEERYIVRLVY